MNTEHSWAGARILSSSGKEMGIASGATKPCTLEGCRGIRVHVRWPGVKNPSGRVVTTWPCSEGLKALEGNNNWQIN